MKLIITGGRSYKDKETVFKVLNEWQAANGTVTCIVQGGAGGADSFARQWAKQNIAKSDENLSASTWIQTYNAAWKLLGKAAGPMRNLHMCTQERDANALIAFPGGRGTKSCIDFAKKLGIPVIVIEENDT